jgi:large subunit ribosomal protein L10
MKREDKGLIIQEISETIKEFPHFYITDIAGLNAEQTSNLRRQCFKSGITLKVVKNTLLQKAFETTGIDFAELAPALKENSAVMFSHTGNAPAKLIKSLREKSPKPVLKGAYVQESIYVGDDQLDALTSIKSREELIGDVVLLLQSPIKNVISAMQSGANGITGVLKTLSEKES